LVVEVVVQAEPAGIDEEHTMFSTPETFLEAELEYRREHLSQVINKKRRTRSRVRGMRLPHHRRRPAPPL
jgi:hypothetical protein